MDCLACFDLKAIFELFWSIFGNHTKNTKLLKKFIKKNKFEKSPPPIKQNSGSILPSEQSASSGGGLLPTASPVADLIWVNPDYVLARHQPDRDVRSRQEPRSYWRLSWAIASAEVARPRCQPYDGAPRCNHIHVAWYHYTWYLWAAIRHRPWCN